jgi:hypothetical protein
VLSLQTVRASIPAQYSEENAFPGDTLCCMMSTKLTIIVALCIIQSMHIEYIYIDDPHMEGCYAPVRIEPDGRSITGLFQGG